MLKSRAAKLVLGLALAALGLACLNYTVAAGAEHHAEWATEHGLPAPSAAIHFAGGGLLLLAGILLGRASRRAAP